MPYVAPGDAFSSAFEDQILKQQNAVRQAQQDKIALEREARLANYQQEELRQGAEALRQKREEFDQTQMERRRANFEKAVQPLPPGYIPDADLLKEADALHMGHLFPPDPNTGGRMYVGDKQEREKREQADKVKKITEQILTVNPGTPEYQKLATEYEMVAGKSLPLRTMGSGDTKAVIRTSPNNKGVVERLVDGQWQKVQGDIPKDSVVLQETPPPADHTEADNARKVTAFNTVHEQAVKEVEKWAQTADTHIQGASDLMQLLNMKTPVSDRLVSPLVLKTIVAGQGTGFRMTRAEIDNITHGRSRWDDLAVAINQWSADPSKALNLSDTQRTDLMTLAKEIRKRETVTRKKTIDYRRKMDDAIATSDIAAVNKARTDLDNELHVSEEDDDSSAPTSSFKPPSFAKPVRKP